MGAEVLIESGVVAAAVQHARECFPWECCGFLIGTPKQISGVVRGENRARRTDRFELGLGDWRRTLAGGGGVVGVYHSHPGGRVEASSVDQGLLDAWLRWMLLVTVDGEWKLVEREG